MQIIYKNIPNLNIIQQTILPIWLLTITEASTLVNMIKNNDYLNHPYLLAFFALLVIALIRIPQKIIITSEYIIKQCIFIPFLGFVAQIAIICEFD